MPLHTSSRVAKTKPSAAGGAEGTRSAVTGRKLGRAAARSLAKNADNAEEYLDAVESAVSAADLRVLLKEHTFLARVERNPGGGHLKVTLQTGEAEMDVSISGTLRFRGGASKKTDRANCFCANDLIVVNAGLAVSKLTSAQVARVRRVFAKHGLETPRGFFTVGDLHAAAEDDDFEFDRSDEERAEAEAAAEAAAARARSQLLKKQQAAAGRGPRLNTGRNLDSVTAALDAETHAATELAAERRRREEEDAAMLFDDAEDAPAAGGGGPNRAARRAAKAAAKAAEQDNLFDLYAAAAAEDHFEAAAEVALPGNADRAWDEVDVDAI
jgi:hypothetical protein